MQNALDTKTIVPEAAETPIFRGGWGSSMMMPWPNCKSNTKKKKCPAAALYQLDYICLFITTYVAYYTAPQRIRLVPHIKVTKYVG